MAACCRRRARSFWGPRRRCNCCHFLSSSGDLAQKAASFRAACRPGLGPGKPQAEAHNPELNLAACPANSAAKSAASNLLIYPASIWYSCVSTPGFWPPDRFSETSTLAYKFGEIAGVPRRQSQPAVRPGAPSAARPILLDGSGDYEVASRSVRIAPLWIPDLVAATRRNSLGRRGDRQADGSVRWSIRPDAH